MTTYRLSPNPIAAEGTLPSGTPVTVTLTASGTSGVVTDASGLLSLTSTASPAGSATATVKSPTQRDGLHNGQHADAHLDADAVHHQRQPAGVDQLHAVIYDPRGR